MRVNPWRVDLCLASTLLAAPFGPSAMCFLRHARGFGWLDPNIPSKATEALPDTTPPFVVEESSLAWTSIDLSKFRARHHRLHTPLSGLPSLRKIAGHEKTLFPIDGLRGPVCLLQLQLQRKNTKVSAYRAGEDNHSKNHNQEPQFHYCRDPNITILLICK